MRASKFVGGLVVLFSLVVGLLFLSGETKWISVREVEIADVTDEERKWVQEILTDGLYLYRPSDCNEQGDCNYLLYSRRELAYHFREVRVSHVGDELTVSVQDRDALHDENARGDQLFRIEAPKAFHDVVLKVNGEQGEFNGITTSY